MVLLQFLVQSLQQVEEEVPDNVVQLQMEAVEVEVAEVHHHLIVVQVMVMFHP